MAQALHSQAFRGSWKDSYQKAISPRPISWAYYEKTGINNLTAIFKNDGTFKFQLKRSALSGEYAKDPDSPDGDFIFQFSIKGKVPVGKVSAHVEKVGNKLTITFDASKLITIVNSIASISGQSTLKSVASLLNSYDGLKCGFELKKQ